MNDWSSSVQAGLTALMAVMSGYFVWRDRRRGARAADAAAAVVARAAEEEVDEHTTTYLLRNYRDQIKELRAEIKEMRKDFEGKYAAQRKDVHDLRDRENECKLKLQEYKTVSARQAQELAAIKAYLHDQGVSDSTMHRKLEMEKSGEIAKVAISPGREEPK